jgi:flagellar basal-body rod protein FlgF
MLYGLYLSAQGAETQQMKMDVIANNMANASTTSFKRDLAIFRTHAPYDAKNGPPRDLPRDQLDQTGGITVGEVFTDFSNGPLVRTRSDFDVALQGTGFFRVNAGGQPMLTRDGRLALSERGELVHSEHGWPFLGANGQPIVVPQGTESVDVATDGTIYQVINGERNALGQLDVVRPQSLRSLEKVGNNLYAAAGRLVPAFGAQVKQGYVESSGTNSVQEMIALISASRVFETNVNMLRLQDDGLGRLLQGVRE